MRNPVKDDGTITNKFDDKMYVFFKNDKGNFMLVKYDITVVPGFNEGSNIIEQNRAILQLGQYITSYPFPLLKPICIYLKWGLTPYTIPTSQI